MRNSYLLLSLLCTTFWFGFSSHGQDFYMDWVRQGTSLGNVRSSGVATDPAGSVYVTGSFDDTLKFENASSVITLLPTGGMDMFGAKANDIFIAKFDPAGNCLWAKKMGGPGTDLSFAIAVDSMGNIYTTGQFSSDKADFNPGTGAADTFYMKTDGNSDVFVSKLDSSGNFIWARQFVTDYAATGNSLALDKQGNVYLAGNFSGSIDFNHWGGGFKLNSSMGIGDDDIFVCKLDRDGNFVWARQMGGPSPDYGSGIAVDENGNAYLTGNFGGTANFNPTGTPMMVTALSPSNVFVAKISSSGTVQWAKALTSESYCYGKAVATDGKGGVYLTGSFSGKVDFDPGTSTHYLDAYNLYGQDIFVSKLNDAGSFVWARQVKSTESSGTGYALTVSKRNAVYVTGAFYGTANFDPDGSKNGTLTSAGKGDGFLLRLDDAGKFSWVKQMMGKESVQGGAVAADGDHSVYTTGFFNGEVNFDPDGSNQLLLAAGVRGRWGYPPDMFLHKLKCRPEESSQKVTSCKSYVFFGEEISKAGIYTHTLKTALGCDSIITLELQIDSPKAVISVNGFELRTSEAFEKYQWFRDGIAIGGATERTFLVTENGDYRVAVEDFSGCADTSEVYSVRNVGIDPDRGENRIGFYPNPSRDFIHIDPPVSVEISIFDMSGKKLLVEKAAKRISVAALSAGLYYLQAEQDGKVLLREKFVKM